ncbi:hypothetical protein GCM10022377_02100 [Zhihengliuella alba]|uniref:Polysaccharide pyruvyl transferase domain-containing protein n=1 Tax=Zhihengliuella alba TaxID=547018 RepID=A0ABP7CM01_9MICC
MDDVVNRTSELARLLGLIESPADGIVLVGDFREKFSLVRLFFNRVLAELGATPFITEPTQSLPSPAAGETDFADLRAIERFDRVLWVVEDWTLFRLELLEAVANKVRLEVVDLSFYPDEERRLRLEDAGADYRRGGMADLVPAAQLTDLLGGVTRRTVKKDIALVTSELLPRKTESLIEHWNATLGSGRALRRYVNPSTTDFVRLLRDYERLVVPEASAERPVGWDLLRRMASAAGVEIDIGLPGPPSSRLASEKVAIAGKPGDSCALESRPISTRRYVMLCGWFGAANLGDELILEETLTVISEERPDLVPVVLSVDPEGTSQRHGVSALGREQLDEMQFVLQHCAALVYAGGGLFQDYDFEEQGALRGLVTGARGSILGYGAYARLARAFDVPVHFYAQGVGPLRSADAQRAFREAIHGAASFSVRDEASARQTSIVSFGAEPSVVVDPVLASATRIDFEESSKHGGIAINLRPWPFADDTQIRSLLRQACKVAEDRGTFIRGVPLSPEDAAYLGRLKSDLTSAGYKAVEGLEILDPVTTGRDMAGALEDVVAAAGMRLHFCVLASSLGISTLGLSYDPKVTSFFEEMSIGSVVDVDALDGGEVARLLANSTAGSRQLSELRQVCLSRGRVAIQQMRGFWRSLPSA